MFNKGRQYKHLFFKESLPTEEMREALYEDSTNTVYDILENPELMAAQDDELMELPSELIRFFHEEGRKNEDLGEHRVSDSVYASALENAYDESSGTSADGYTLASACFRYYSEFVRTGKEVPEPAQALVDRLMPLALDGKLVDAVPDIHKSGRLRL